MAPFVLTSYLITLVASLSMAILSGPSEITLVLFLSLCGVGIFAAVGTDREQP